MHQQPRCLSPVHIKYLVSLKKKCLNIHQALYVEVFEILWIDPEKFEGIIPRLGVFHTICTLHSIIGKRFQDAGLRGVKAGIVADGSVIGVIKG